MVSRPNPVVENEDNEYTTDYSIGRDVIYVAFSWSLAEQAYEKMKTLAEKHAVGFFDASCDEGDILFPDNNGRNMPINSTSKLSSIEQIKRLASPGQEDKSVKRNSLWQGDSSNIGTYIRQ